MRRAATHAVLFALLAIVLCMPLSAQTAPVSRTWTPPYPLAQDGPRCVGFAFETWERTEPYPSTYPVPADLLYERAKVIDGIHEDGTTLEAVTTILEQYGRIQSYTILRGFVGMTWAQAWSHVYQARDYILDHAPIVIAGPWYAGMNRPAPDHYVIPVGYRDANHAYTCFGYDGQAWAFLCQNTWSGIWNGNGKFLMHAEDLARLVQQGAEIEMPVKVPADPIFSPYLMAYRIQ